MLSVDVLRPKIDEHEVVVGAAGDDAVTVLGQAGGERLGIHDDLPLVIAELRLERFVKADGLGRDDVHERAALDAREHGARRSALANCSWHMTMPPRGPRRLLCVVVVTNCACGIGRGMLAAGDEPGDVRHVDEQKRADGIGDLAHAREIDDARIGGGAGGDHGRANFLGLFLQGVVIDLLRLRADAVLRDLVKFAGEIRRMAVGEMAAVREVHGENFVAGL